MPKSRNDGGRTVTIGEDLDAVIEDYRERLFQLSKAWVVLQDEIDKLNEGGVTPPEEPSKPASDIVVFKWPTSGSDADRDLFPYQQAHPHGIQFVEHDGDGAAQFLLRESDPREPITNGFRAEYSMWGSEDPRHMFGEGDELWVARWLYFPSDAHQGKNSTWDDRLIFQHPDSGSPMFSLHAYGIGHGSVTLGVRQKRHDGAFVYHGRRSVSMNTPVLFVEHVKWSQQSGYYSWWIDGTEINSYTGRTLAVRNRTSVKWGIYGQPTKYLDLGIAFAPGNGTNRSQELVAAII